MRLMAALVLSVAVLAVACEGDILASFTQSPNSGNYQTFDESSEAVLFPPGHGWPSAGAEWWVEISLKPYESDSYLDWSFTVDYGSPGKLPVTGDNSSPIRSTGNNYKNDNRVVLGPMTTAATPVARCKNPKYDNCEVWWTNIFYIDCRSCSEGERASTCNPGARQSTTCTKCDGTTAAGTYCTGAKPSYSQRVDGASVSGVPGQAVGSSPLFAFTQSEPPVKPCPPGFSCVNGQKSKCAGVGVFCPEGTGADSRCPTGFSCLNPLTKTQCPAGTMCPAGQTEPIPCFGGTYQPEAGKGDCLPCPARHHCPSLISAELCPAGFRCPERTQVAEACPVGNFAPAGAAACLPCPVGTISVNSLLSGLGNPVCDPCPVGTFQDRSGQMVCKACPAGTVAPSAGATVCQACNDAGTSGVNGSKIDLAKSTCRCAFGFSGPTCSIRDSVVTPGPETAGSTLGSTGGTSGGGAGLAGPIIGTAAAVAVVCIAGIVIKRRRSAPYVESRLGPRLQP
jgi:hypothetical protein